MRGGLETTRQLIQSLGKPVVLVGIMGSGKSTIGRKLAKKLGLQFYDSDKAVEEAEGMPIVDIYDFKGKKYFADREEETVKKILDYGPVILSTGSGTFLNPDLRNLVKDKAIAIFLKASFAVLYNRVSRRNTRPELMVGDKKMILQEIVASREPIYAEGADIIVESGDFNPYHVVDMVVEKLKKYLESRT